MISKNKILIVFCLFALALANIYVVWPLFLGEYDQNMSSIGVAHILNARYIGRFFFHGWNPFWYGGFPNHLIYPLLAPMILALIQKIFSFLTMPQIYRIVVASSYVLIPIGIFFLTHKLSKRIIPSFLAGLIYILAPSANYFLIPGFRSIGENINFAPWQLSVISDYGEGPHIIDLAIVPFAIIAYFNLLKKPTFYRFLITAVLLSIIVSINLFSAYALGYFMLGVFISEILLGQFKQKLGISLLLLPVVYGLMAYCYDLSMIRSLAASGYIHPENVFRLPPVTDLFLLLIFVIGPAGFIFFEIFKHKPELQNKIIVGVWFLIFWLIPLAFYKGYWFGSQPNRYMPELNLATAVIAAFLLTWVYDFTKKNLGKAGGIAAFGIFAGEIILIIFISLGFIKNSWPGIVANQNIKGTSEYKIAKWLDQNTDYHKGERAYLTGSPAFFMNEFADVPQIRGDEDNAQANHWWADIVYQVNKGEDGELARNWLSTYNVRYIVVDETAVTPYKDFDHPQKFSDLQAISEIDGFKIYNNPGSGDIIQTVDLGRVTQLPPFANSVKPVLDKESLRNYLLATSPAPGIGITYKYEYRTNPDLAVVNVNKALSNTGILFKTTYNSGWRAKVKLADGSQRTAEITKTGPDLMLINPRTSGDYTLEISYNRPLVEYFGYLTTVVTLTLIIYLLIFKKNFLMVKINDKADYNPQWEEEE